MGFIYLIRNNVNGKCYVGKSKRDPHKKRIKRHLSGEGSKLIKSAVAKYGKDSFSYEILHEGIIPEMLNMYEIEEIKNYNAKTPSGYNLTDGGEGLLGMPMPLETRQKLSKAAKSRMKCPERRKKLSKIMKGRKHSDETRKKMSESSKTRVRKPLSSETRKKIGAANKGKSKPPISEKTRRKLSVASSNISDETRMKRSKALSGKNHPLYGKKHSLETRRKMVLAAKKHITPERNKKISEAKRTKGYHDAFKFYCALPQNMPLPEKRKLLREKFPDRHRGTIHNWVKGWQINLS